MFRRCVRGTRQPLVPMKFRRPPFRECAPVAGGGSVAVGPVAAGRRLQSFADRRLDGPDEQRGVGASLRCTCGDRLIEVLILNHAGQKSHALGLGRVAHSPCGEESRPGTRTARGRGSLLPPQSPRPRQIAVAHHRLFRLAERPEVAKSAGSRHRRQWRNRPAPRVHHSNVFLWTWQ